MLFKICKVFYKSLNPQIKIENTYEERNYKLERYKCGLEELQQCKLIA